jgi:hypothetical protein
MIEQRAYTLDLSHFRIPRRDAGWIYSVRTNDFVRAGKTTDPHRRLLRGAKTWCPNALAGVLQTAFVSDRRKRLRKLEFAALDLPGRPAASSGAFWRAGCEERGKLMFNIS